MGKKFNNIKPGTICTLTHNKSVVFRITHVNDQGMPFAKYSYFHYANTTGKYEFQIDDKPVCMAYTTEYEEASKEQKEIFIKMESKEIYFTKFKNALHKRIVEFKYKKKNGEIRIARGTLNIDLMGENNAPKGNAEYVPDNTIRYFDTDANGWRSFIIENFIDWID